MIEIILHKNVEGVGDGRIFDITAEVNGNTKILALWMGSLPNDMEVMKILNPFKKAYELIEVEYRLTEGRVQWQPYEKTY